MQDSERYHSFEKVSCDRKQLMTIKAVQMKSGPGANFRDINIICNNVCNNGFSDNDMFMYI